MRLTLPRVGIENTLHIIYLHIVGADDFCRKIMPDSITFDAILAASAAAG